MTSSNQGQQGMRPAGGTSPRVPFSDGKRSTGPGRNRSWGLITLAALLVIGLGLVGAVVVSKAGDKTPVLAVRAPVAKGQVIERGDLVSTSVAGVRDAIPVGDIDQVVGKTAAVDLVQGQIVTEPVVTADPVPGEGRAVVGLSLDPARVPSAGVQPGDLVDVIAVPGGDTTKAKPDELDAPPVLADAAEVYAVSGVATDGGQVLLTLIVDEGDGPRLAAYSTQSRVAVVETAPQAEAEAEAEAE